MEDNVSPFLRGPSFNLLTRHEKGEIMAETRTLASKFTDIDLERSLLAAIAYEPDKYWEIIDILPPEALTETQRSFERLAAAIEQRQPLPTVKEKPQEEAVDLANKLADLYQKRLLANLGEAFMDDLLRGTPTVDLLGRLEYRLNNVQQAIRERRSGQVAGLYNLLPKALKGLETGRIVFDEEGTQGTGLPTGLPRLDKLLGGLKPGLHLLVAEPGQGKTSFCLQVALHVVQNGFPALFLTFQDLLSKLALKAICQAAELEMKKFTDEGEQLLQLNLAAQKHGQELMGLHFMEGTGRLTVSQVKAKILQLMKNRNAERSLIIVDHLQRWAAGKRDFNDLNSNTTALASELYELAFRLEIPILIISVQNKLDQGIAGIKNIVETGDLEYSADSVLVLSEAGKMRTAPPPLPAKAMDLLVEKNRYGDTGRIELVFRPNIGHFREVSREK